MGNNSRKIIRLTEDELRQSIFEAVVPMLNEEDAAIYTRVYNASHRIRKDNRQSVNGPLVDKNNERNRSRQTEPNVQVHELDKFIGKDFRFYSENELGLVVIIKFVFSKVKKLAYHNTILTGTVLFEDTQIDGDRIIVDFAKNRVRYRERGSGCFYNLEIDNRFKSLWNELLMQLENAMS